MKPPLKYKVGPQKDGGYIHKWATTGTPQNTNARCVFCGQSRKWTFGK